MIGDLESGYMIAPATRGVHERLRAAGDSGMWRLREKRP